MTRIENKISECRLNLKDVMIYTNFDSINYFIHKNINDRVVLALHNIQHNIIIIDVWYENVIPN